MPLKLCSRNTTWNFIQVILGLYYFEWYEGKINIYELCFMRCISTRPSKLYFWNFDCFQHVLLQAVSPSRGKDETTKTSTLLKHIFEYSRLYRFSVCISLRFLFHIIDHISFQHSLYSTRMINGTYKGKEAT